jgi:hypothetical protein
MKIIIDLPESSQSDAEAFGLWLGTILHDDEVETKIGDIQVAQ